MGGNPDLQVLRSSWFRLQPDVAPTSGEFSGTIVRHFLVERVGPVSSCGCLARPKWCSHRRPDSRRERVSSQHQANPGPQDHAGRVPRNQDPGRQARGTGTLQQQRFMYPPLQSVSVICRITRRCCRIDSRRHKSSRARSPQLPRCRTSRISLLTKTLVAILRPIRSWSASKHLVYDE